MTGPTPLRAQIVHAAEDDRRLAEVQPAPGTGPATADDFVRGRQILDDHATALLGPARLGRDTRIMVTLRSEAATDAQLVERIVGA